MAEIKAMCDHITGLAIASRPQDGEQDFLARASDTALPDEPFRYCPNCGELIGRIFVAASDESEHSFSRFINLLRDSLNLIKRDWTN